MSEECRLESQFCQSTIRAISMRIESVAEESSRKEKQNKEEKVTSGSFQSGEIK